MSPAQRITVLVVAVVILAGGFILARGSDDDDKDDAAQPTQPAQTQAETAPQEAENPASTTPVETTESAPPPPRVETVRIEDGGPVGEAKTLEFDSGDTIRLRFESNAAAEVHIHGYDKYVNVPAGGSARTRFKASAEGIFEIEEHHTAKVLAKLQVSP